MSEQTYTSVREVMTPNPVMVDGLATVSEAVDLMRENGISSSSSTSVTMPMNTVSWPCMMSPNM